MRITRSQNEEGAVHRSTLLTSMFGLIVAAIVGTTAPTFAQGNFVYSISDVNAQEGLLYNQEISPGVMNDATVSGWSLSVCHDSTVSDICGGEFTDFAVSINVLGPPFFQALGIDDRATNGGLAFLFLFSCLRTS
ncbi:MAG: hypothetical protein AAF581_20100 [Planctomycetota bacterium]